MDGEVPESFLGSFFKEEVLMGGMRFGVTVGEDWEEKTKGLSEDVIVNVDMQIVSDIQIYNSHASSRIVETTGTCKIIHGGTTIVNTSGTGNSFNIVSGTTSFVNKSNCFVNVPVNGVYTELITPSGASIIYDPLIE